jgi:hypothetical protein
MAVSDLLRHSAALGYAHRPGSNLTLPLVLLAGLAVAAAAFISYALWPRWPAVPVGPDAPPLPITVAGVSFNVPPGAMRIPLQRQAGQHERVDLAFLWPSLVPPEPLLRTPGAPPTSPRAIDRLFVTIAAAGGTLAPAERIKTIYPRYVVAEPGPGPDGLAIRPFRSGTPYQGEDLIYNAVAPDEFLVRCSRNGAGPTPGICLYNRRVGGADIVVRFPRDWLTDWRALDTGITRLIDSLRPHAG